MQAYINLHDYLLSRYAKAAGIDLENATRKESALLARLLDMSEGISYDSSLKPEYIEKKLRESHKTGKNIRIVPDRKFWKNGNCHNQTDGWTYHLQLYKPRTEPVYYDSKGNIFTNTIIFFRKKIEGGKIWSVYTNLKGPLYITFDKKTIYNLWIDYPDNFTPEQIAIFKTEMPYWVEYFED